MSMYFTKQSLLLSLINLSLHIMKNILITGATTGLGLSLKQHYESQWYTVYNLSRSSNEFVCDLSNKDSIIACANNIKQQWIVFDIIVACAGGWEIRSIDTINRDTANSEWQINTLWYALLISELWDEIKAHDTDIVAIGATIW
jgi:short-subunit dehydrogenase